MRINIAAFVSDERTRPVGQKIVHKQHRTENGRWHTGAENLVHGNRVIAIGEWIARALWNPARRVPDKALCSRFIDGSGYAANHRRAVLTRLQRVSIENSVRPFKGRNPG